MKKIILLLIFGCLIPCSIHAQDISYGLRAGLNLIPFEKTIDHGPVLRPGWNAGAYLNYPLNNFLSLQTELYYTFKASNYSHTDTSSLLDMAGMFGFDP